jgi:hypothetical protein
MSVIKYLHVAEANRPGKWRDIALNNLARGLTVAELEDLLPRCRELTERMGRERLERYERLKAPASLIELTRKEMGKENPSVAIVRRMLARRQRGE